MRDAESLFPYTAFYLGTLAEYEDRTAGIESCREVMALVGDLGAVSAEMRRIPSATLASLCVDKARVAESDCPEVGVMLRRTWRGGG